MKTHRYPTLPFVARIAPDDGTFSNAPPTFFRACIEQSTYVREGYARAGYHLAIHARQLVAESVDRESPILAEFDEILSVERSPSVTAERVVAWLDRALPRCMQLVPRRRRESFTRGVAWAFDEDN